MARGREGDSVKHTKHVSRARVVMYAFGEGVNEASGMLDCECVLASAKAAGVIINYDDGRDRDPWFEGPPGASMRGLRDQFIAAGYRLKKLVCK